MTRILHCVASSAAIHKGCDLASKLTQAGHQVRVVLTPRAAKLVSPQLFEALTGERALSDEFSAERRGGMDHIDLASWAELCVVAPASADLVSRLALGLADDLPTTVCLALPREVPRLLCPAMNPHMLQSPPLQRNLARLVEDGWQVVDPGAGHLACGVKGQGRMAEPAEIQARIAAILRA